eukprot:g1421.t1
MRRKQSGKAEEEEERLAKLYKEWEERRAALEACAEFEECKKLTAINVRAISRHYANHDEACGTMMLSPILLREMAASANYLDSTRREMIFGPKGYMNTGYPVEVYGAWPGGRALSKNEKEAAERAKDSIQLRMAEIDAHSKSREHPHDFDSGRKSKQKRMGMAVLWHWAETPPGSGGLDESPAHREREAPELGHQPGDGAHGAAIH